MNETINPTSEITILLEEAEKIRVSTPQQSIRLVEEALAKAKLCNNNFLEAQSLSKLAFYNMIVGDFEQSIVAANEAIKLFEQQNYEQGITDAKYTIASIYYKTDAHHLGMKYLIECINSFKKNNQWANLAKSYKALGTVYQFYKDIENALKAYELSIEAAKTINNNDLISNSYNNLSGLLLNLGKIKEATEMIEESIILKTESKDVRGLAFALYGRGKVNLVIKNFEAAKEDLFEALTTHQQVGEKLGQSMALQKIGSLFQAMGDYESAEQYFYQAYDLSSSNKIKMILSKASHSLYAIHKLLGNHKEALHYLEIYENEMSLVVRNQTHEIVSSYNMLHIQNAKAVEDKLQIEKLALMAEKEKAEVAAEARLDFLSTMSHEIRTPLNAVITIPKLLKQKSDAEEQHLLDALTQASNNLQTLINDILDISKLDAGKMQINKAVINIQDLVNNIKTTYENFANDKGLQLNVNLDTALHPFYLIDEGKVMQVLNNLVSNAIKFTNKGEVTIQLKKITADAKADTILFEVKDTGEGIPKAFIKDIFKSFTQSKTTSNSTIKGTGLGMTIVKKIIELLGSTIEVESELNKGSRFSFSLQLPRATIIKDDDKILELKELHDLKVLIVDDNDINLLVAGTLLSRWNVQTIKAGSGKEAIRIADNEKFDLILMDIQMPEMNGYDTTITLRNHCKQNKTTPIYALTADVHLEEQESYGHYFNGFLAKPFELNKLFAVLKTVQQRHSQNN